VRTLSNLSYVTRYILNPLFVYKGPTVSVDQVHARQVTIDGPKTRPIIVCFRDYKDVEIIMSNASRLKHKPQYDINRDYPS